jgi:hypothetical protein
MSQPAPARLAGIGKSWYEFPMSPTTWRFFVCLLLLALPAASQAAEHKPAETLWVLKPVVRPEIPTGLTQSTNPIDAFVAEQYRVRNLKPVGAADKRTLLRRVYLDLTGLPPSPAEQDAFLQDESPDAYEKVVDKLLASEQHGVRYARHWLDVLRYADTDENMVARQGIYLWRDWVIRALNDDVPYDQFVRAQLTGYRSTTRTQITATGYRIPTVPRLDDVFALGFLSRNAGNTEVRDSQELAISAVETVSTAFMGLTVGCAKCHDHMYDPIKQRDFYAMKALFDPLVARKVTLASAQELFDAAKKTEETDKKRAEIEKPMNELIEPYKQKLYDDRVGMLPADVQAVIRKPEKERTAQEQKIADDYYPILRIDPEKITEVLPEADREKYKEYQKQLDALKGPKGRQTGPVPVFWTVEVDGARELQTNYILNSGNPEKPEKNHPVRPGWPFAPTNIDFREGRIEAFSDWLTASENPLFARVAVNRLWQWHFGEGLQKTASDFGELGGVPSNPKLLDWLASEFAQRRFSMKQLHRLIVTSDTYKLASDAEPEFAAANSKTDANDTFLWHFRLQRLDAEPIWDSILSAAGNLDLSVGGSSFSLRTPKKKADTSEEKDKEEPPPDGPFNRRAAYMTRGYSSSRDVMPSFLSAFDVDDGRTPCPMRTQTVTAPQSLFLMNSPEINDASERFANRLRKESAGDLTKAVSLAYEDAIARPPSPAEQKRALAYLENDPARLKDFAWLLFNLDEFVYVR